MGKRRYNPENMDKAPQIKRDIADFLASRTMMTRNQDVHAMLVYGVRGFIQMSTKDLCKEFDKALEKMIEDGNALQDELNQTKDQWERRQVERTIQTHQALLDEAYKIGALIFEETILK